MDGEEDRVLMKKEEGVDYEVDEMVTGRWSLKKEEVVMTEEVEQVFIEQKQVVEMKETVEEQWSLEKGEVVMTEEVEQVWMNKKPVVEVSETVEEQWFLEKGEVVKAEKVEQISMDKKQVVEVNETMEERWSLGKEEVVKTEEVEQVMQEEEEGFVVNEIVTGQLSLEKGEVVMTEEAEQVLMDKKQVVEVNEMVAERWSLEKEDVLEMTKTIIDQWILEKKERVEIADGKDEVSDKTEDWVTNFNDNKITGKTRESCEALVEYEKAVRKFLAHTTHCSKCVDEIKIDVPHTNTISILFAIGFIVQLVQLFISSVVNSGGLLRRTRFMIKQSYESVVTRAYVFVYKTQSRTWSVLKRSYVRVITMKAYVSIKQTLQRILIKQQPHAAGEVLTGESTEGVDVDPCAPVIVAPSGVHRLIRRTRLVLKQSYESVVTRLYVFLWETQGLLSRTKIVLMRSSVREVTIKTYISVKQILNRLLIKQEGEVTPSGSNNMRDSNVSVRRLFFFGVISVLLCLSGTQLMVNQEYHIAVTTKANFFVKQTYDYWFPTDQVNGANVNKVVDVVIVEQKDDSQTDDHMVKKVTNLVVVEQKDAIQTDDHLVKEVVDLVAVEKKENSQTDDHVVKEGADLVVIEQKNDSQTLINVVKEVVDLVVVEQKDDSQTGINVVKKVVDLVVVEQKDDSQTGINVVKEVVDLVVVEQKDDSQTRINVVKEVVDLVVVEQTDDRQTGINVVKEVVDLVVVEQKDDSQTGINVVKEVVDLVVVEQKDESQVGINVVKEVVDLVVVEQKDDSKTGINVVKEVVDLVVVEQKDDSQTGIDVVKEVVDLVVVEQKDDSQTGTNVVKEVVDLVVVEQKDDSQAGINVVKGVVDLVVIEQKDDSQTGINVVKEVVDLVVVEQKDDTDHHDVNEVVDLVGADQSDDTMVSNEVDDYVVINEPVELVVVQEKDVERLLKTWIKYAVTLVQKGLIKRVYFIAGISVLFFVFFCVYIAITKLQRTRINDVATIVINGVTSGSFFVAMINVVSDVFLWVTVNIIELPRRTLSVLYTRVVTIKEYVIKQTRRTLSVLYIRVVAMKEYVVKKTRKTLSVLHTRVVTMKEYVVKQTRDRLNQLVDGQVVPGESIHKVVTSSEHDGLLKPGIVGKEGDKAAAKQLDNKVDAEQAKDHVVTKPEDSKKEHVDAGKEGKTNIRGEHPVVNNEGLIRARISYVTSLVLNGHIRTWSTIKQTYHKVFTGKTDGDLDTNGGDDNVVTGPANDSGYGRVVITQIKYMISQVLKVHKWFVVEQVYHRVFKWRAQTGVVTSQEDHGNVLTNQAVEGLVVEQEDRRVTMWSLAKQTTYQLVVGTKLRLGSWTTIHVTTRVQTELLRIRSAIKLEKVLNVEVLRQATKKLLHWLRHLVSKEEILKSIVYGGLTEIIASISIIAFFADFDTTILNVIAFALAGLLGGCFFFATNIWELKKGGGDTYREQLGRVNYFPFHATLAMLSFIIFGMIPPSTFVFSFLKTDDKKIAIWVVSAVSLFCLSLLAIFKAYVTSTIRRFKYVKTVLWYHLIAMSVSICSYLASKMVKGSIEELGLFDTSTCDAMSRHN